MSRSLSRAVGAFAALAVLTLPLSASAAGSGATAEISNVRTDSGVIQFVFTAKGLPPGSRLNPDSVVVASGSDTLSATASTGTATTVNAGKAPLRESVVVIDTSGSMHGDGIRAARTAALAYAAAMPADVRIGLVTFSERPNVLVKPTTNRKALRAAIRGVQAGGNTSLYDGIIAAIGTLGRPGVVATRRLLVLSDGDDTSSSHSVGDAVSTAKSAGVPVDAVAFRLPGDPTVLKQIASASKGQVLSAQSAAGLASTFETAAAAFQSQVLVTAQVPSSLAGKTEHLVVTMNSQDQSVEASFTITLPAAGSGAKGGIGGPSVSAAAAHTSDTTLWVVLAVSFVVILIAALLAVWVPESNRTQSGKQSRIAEVNRYRVLAVLGREQAPARSVNQEGAVAKATLSFFDNLVRSGGQRQTIIDRLERAGLRIRPEEWMIIQVAAVLVAGAVLAVVAFNAVIGALAGGILGYLACQFFLRHKIASRSRAFNDQLPDVLQLVAGSLRSGFSLNQAVASVVREGSEPTASEIARALTEVRLGSELEDALDRVADRMQCPDLHWVVLAVRISREVGGNLAEVLMNTVGTMRERAQIRGQIRVLSAEGRISARILIALPFLVGGFLAVLKPVYLKPLINTGTGIALVVLGVILLAVGSFWITRLVKIEV